jgi:uncharacterized protein YdeI (YjbR/CyaY-like superfamily)
MVKFDETLDTIYAKNRQEWRDWLQQNHQSYRGIWLVYYKVKSDRPSIRYPEAVREALCFGWIDSKIKSVDRERYRQIFTPRKPTSVWSKLNKQYIIELIDLGLMTEAGLTKIEIAKQNGSWMALDEIEALIIPEDLELALLANETARQNFQALSNSQKKNILANLNSAKRTETRLKRLDRVINSLLVSNETRSKGWR